MIFGDRLLRDMVDYAIGHFFNWLPMHHWRCHGGAKNITVGSKSWMCIEHDVADNEVDCGRVSFLPATKRNWSGIITNAYAHQPNLRCSRHSEKSG